MRQRLGNMKTVTRNKCEIVSEEGFMVLNYNPTIQ